jgi:phosphoglycerate dehydrogenase-like enzyme
MTYKIQVGITRDFFDKNGVFIIPEPGLKKLDGIPGVSYTIIPEFLKEITPAQIKEFDIVITFRPLWPEGSIAANERLISIHRFGVGFERLDVDAITKAGIMLCLTPGAVRRPMAVVYLTFLLALSTKLLIKDRLIRDGRWSEHYQHAGYGLVNKTLGAVGVGNIGCETFNLAKPLGMRHIAFDPYAEPGPVAEAGVEIVDFETVLKESDYLMLCCPLNNETHHLIGENEFKMMKDSAFIINAARGPVVHENALIRALQEGWIQGAGLDVFENEPVDNDNPLLEMDNVILSPHALGDTDQSLINMWDNIVEQISSICKGNIPSDLHNTNVLKESAYSRRRQGFIIKLDNLGIGQFSGDS